MTSKRLLSLTLACLLVLLAIPARADLVTPQDRVVTRVKVRAEPGGERIDSLEKGETAELLGSVPYYHRVRLDNGTVGYVSKAWTDLVSEAATIRLGAWNIKNLGYNNQKDYAKVAEIIEENFDILAVVEVMRKENDHPGYAALLTALGSGWSGQVTDSPRPNKPSVYAEFYAVVYRNNLVKPCSGWSTLVYFQDNDGSEGATGTDKFDREPAYGCYEAPVGADEPSVDFLLGVFHSDPDEAEAEVSHIDEVFTEMASSDPDEKDIFIGGDYNLEPDEIETAEASLSVTTQGTGSTVNSSGGRTDNLLDHIVVHDSSESSEVQGNPRILDVTGEVDSGQIYHSTISDHLPVVVEVRASGADDD